jgi:hypothetical protein
MSNSFGRNNPEIDAKTNIINLYLSFLSNKRRLQKSIYFTVLDIFIHYTSILYLKNKMKPLFYRLILSYKKKEYI